jgi:uncharacterized protein DUF4279
VRIRQYAYFSMRSRHVPAAEITARLGIEPDEIRVRGTRRLDPPVPVRHSWDIVCRRPGMTIDEQIETVVARLRPYTGQLRVLLDELRADDPDYGGGALTVVRYFDDEDGEDEELSPADARLQKLPGQHQLLGWVLSRQVIEFLMALDIELDADEYG